MNRDEILTKLEAYEADLRARGVTHAALSVPAEALNDASQENLATKLDIALLKGELSELRAELKSDIAGS